MSFESLRASIPAMRESVYMNSGWAGPSPEPVVARIREVLARESAHGPASIEGLRASREANEATQAAVARLLNAKPTEILITHGTTEGVNVVLYGLDWRPGDELLTCNLEHPAIATPSAVLEERFGVKVTRLEVAPNATEQEMLDAVEAAISPRTKVVALSHIQYTCGLRMPIERITAIAHRAGALVVADGAQTGGHIAIDVRRLGVDFYCISGQKWLLGPQGTGAMFVAEERARSIQPLFSTHAIADARAMGGEATAVQNVASRFRLASQSPALVAGLGAAIELLLEIGMEEVEAHANRLAERMRRGIEQIAGAYLTGARSGGVCSGLVSAGIEGWEPRQVVEELWQRWRIAGRAVSNPAAVRFSHAAFNTETDVDKVLAALGVLASEKPAITVEAHH